MDKNKNGTFIDDVILYIMDNYGHSPEYLWQRYPSDCIFRCQENKKWYALIMNVKKKNIHIHEDGNINILNIKADTILIQKLIQKQGFLPAYHLNKKTWLTILLDGTVQKETVFKLIDKSYEIVKSNKKSC